MEIEIWKLITAFPEYEVSNLGRVKSLSRSRSDFEYIMKTVTPTVWDKYPCVYLRETVSRKSRVRRLHRLVVEAHLPKVEGKNIVNHIDGDKFNNKLENLEWVTSSENNQHAYDTGLKIQNKEGWGTNAKPVVGLEIATGDVKEFGGVRVTERELGLSSSSVKDVCKGRSSHAQGWYFMYKEDYAIKGFPNNIKPIPRFNKKPVMQLDLEGKHIKTFESAREAAIEVGCQFAKISSVANNNRKTTGGYKWKFVEAQ